MSQQLHAGKLNGTGDEVWHSMTENGKPVYFCGSWHHRSPAELYAECQTIIADLVRNHPELTASDPAPIDLAELEREQTH